MTEATDIRIRLGRGSATKLGYELSIIDGIKQGLSDIKSGNVVPHADAMSELHDTIRNAEGSGNDRLSTHPLSS